METKSLSFEQMENLEGGMSCGWSYVFWGAAFISLAAATGGLSAIGMVGATWGVIDNCG